LCNGGFIRFNECGSISGTLSYEFDGLILDNNMDFLSIDDGDGIEISQVVILVVFVPPP
jgi:hypothetical protein